MSIIILLASSRTLPSTSLLRHQVQRRPRTDVEGGEPVLVLEESRPRHAQLHLVGGHTSQFGSACLLDGLDGAGGNINSD